VRTVLTGTLEAARALVAAAALEGAVGIVTARAERLVAFLPAGTEWAVARLDAWTERLIAIATAERLVSALAGLPRAVVACARTKGAVPVFAGLAEGPVTRGAATVGASRRTALAIIVIAVGHGGLIAEDDKRSEGHG
jgi:hypothetical protein